MFLKIINTQINKKLEEGIGVNGVGYIDFEKSVDKVGHENLVTILKT